ncbi:MAG: S24 family peptidase [Sphingomonadaceae bacterium]
MSDARQRLLELAEERGSSLSGLSRLIGRNATYLQQFIRKGSPKKLEEEDRRVLAEFFGVPESELGAREENSYVSSVPKTKGEWVDVPRLPLGASAGPGAIAQEEAPFDSFRFSRRWLREQGLDSAMLSAIAVEGDSMEPLLRHGDEILVDRTPRPLRDGIHVLRVGESLLVKRVAQSVPGRVTLLSQNLAYPPVEVDLDDVDVIGRVVWKGGRL